MTFYVLTLFPQTFSSIFSQSIIQRAQSNKLINIKIVNLRNFASGKHKKVDDKPYGGGPGMILKVDIIVKALESIKPKPYSILLSATGTRYNQSKASSFSNKKTIAIICGHYEGIDARVENFTNEIISIGDYILTGGEIAAAAIIDSTTRLLPKVINSKSLQNESFSTSNLLEHPQYTRPPIFRNSKVPDVLLNGNHNQIAKWRKEKAAIKTLINNSAENS